MYTCRTNEFDYNLSLDMQIFPIHMKGSAGSLVTLVSWLGSWIVSYAFNFLLLWSSYGKYIYSIENRLVIKRIVLVDQKFC